MEEIMEKKIALETALENVEKLPLRYFGDTVKDSTVSDGVNYRFRELVWLYNETTKEVKLLFPSDLVPEGLPIGDDGLPAYKARPEKKQEMIDELKIAIENEVK